MDKYIFKKLFRIRKYFSCFLLAASFFAASFNFVQAAFVQQGSVVYAVNAPQDLTINGVTSGNSLIVVVGRTSSASRSYNVTSNLDGAFTLVADTTASIATFPQRIYVLHGTTAGNHTITISQVSNTNQPIQATVIEASGLDSAASPIDSSFVDGSATTTHYAAQSGLIDTTTGSFMVISGWLNGGNSGVTVGSGGFTLFPSLGNSAISAWLYKESSAGETDQRGEFANAGTPRSAYSAIAAFPYANDTISISGNVYSDEGVTSMSGTQTVRAKVNGLGDYTGTLSSGAYTISGVEVDAAGDVITVFLDGAAEDAVTVTRAASNSSNITGLDLYQDHVILRHEDAGPITNTNLDQYDNGADGDIPFTVTAGALNVSASTTLFILSGDSFTPGGDVTTPKMKSVGTFNAGSHNLNLTDSATPLSISGTFNAGTGTVNYTGSSATSIASTTYYNLGVATSSDVGAGVTYTLAGDTTVSNMLMVGNAASTNSDTLALSTSTLNIAGSGTPLVITSKGALSADTGTVNYNGSSATNVALATYYNLGLGTTSDVGSGVTYTLAGNTTVSNVLTVGNAASTNSDTLALSTYILSLGGSGTPLSITSKGALSADTGDVRYNGASATSITPAAYYDLGVGRFVDSNSVTYTLAGDVTVSNVFTVGLNLSTGMDTLALSTYAVNLTGSGTPLSISSKGTISADTGTINYNGSSATNVASATYYNLGLGTTSDSGSGVTYTLAGNTTVSNVLTVGNASSTNSDTLALSTYALGLAGSGTPLVITSKGALSGGTGTVNYTGSSATNVTAATYYDLGLGTTSDVGSAVTYSLAGNISANSITVGNASSTNSDTLTQGTHNITTTGSGTVITVTSKGVWSNISTGDIVLSGNVSNAGAIVLNSNNGTECVDGADDIVITSSVGATQRTWSGAGTFTIYNVSATDQAGTITAYTSTFSNTTWTVGDCGITISGTVYTDEGVTTMGAGRTVSIKINGAGTYSTTTDGSGAYSIPYITIASAGDVITAFLDGATEDAVTVSRALDATTDITGFNLYQNTVIVRHEDAGPITNTDLSQYDSSGDADIQYAVSLGSLTVSSGNKLIVWTGDTFTPGGVVITPKMLIDGTYVKEHNLSLTGIGTGSGRPLVVNGSITTSSINFYYLGDGDLEVEDVDGSYIYLNPTLTGSATYTLLGNDYFAMSAGPGSDSANTLTIEATSDISVLVILVSPTGSALATFDTGNGGYEIGVNSLLVGTGATYNANNSILALYGADNPFSVSGTFNAGTSTVYYINNSSAQNIAPVTYYNLVSQKGSSTNTLGGNVTVGNDLTITGGTLNLSTHNLTVSGDTSISGILDDSSTTGTNTFVGNVLINSGGSFFPSRNSNATIRGGITNDGTFNVGTGTWTFNTNNQEINGDNPLTFAGVISVDSGVNLTNNNSISMTATTTGSLAGAGTFTNGVNAAFNYTGSTVTINALDLSANRNTFTYNSTTTGQTVFATTYHNLIINKTGQTATLGGDTVVENNLTITNGTLTSNLEGNLDVRGDFVNNGTFNHNDGTVSFSGISKVSNISGETTFHNLSVNTPGKRVRFTNGETFVVEGELEILGEVGNPVILRSTLDSSRWFLDLEGTHNINHVNIKDSGCDVTSLEIDLSSKNAINSGNNGSCWVFGVAKVGGGNGNGGAIPGEESGSGPQESGGGQGGGGSEGGEGSGGGQQEGGGGSGGGSGGDLGLLTGWRVFAIYLSPNFGLLLN